jgi:hypothetical protein
MASRQPWQSTNPNIRMTTRRIPDGTPCGYCFDEWATVWDHLQPWSKRGKSVPSNLYPSCRRCNALLSSLSFPSIEEKREYVRTTLIERGDWNPIMEGAAFMSDVPQTFSEIAEDAEILQPGVPQTRMGRRSKKDVPLSDLPNTVREKKAASEVLQREVPVARVAESKSSHNGLKTRICRMCRDVFKPRRRNQLFCDKTCQAAMRSRDGRIELRMLNLLQDQIELRMKGMFDLEKRCSKCEGKGARRGQKCLTCSGHGSTLTPFGLSVISLIGRRRSEIRW